MAVKEEIGHFPTFKWANCRLTPALSLQKYIWRLQAFGKKKSFGLTQDKPRKLTQAAVIVIILLNS